MIKIRPKIAVSLPKTTPALPKPPARLQQFEAPVRKTNALQGESATHATIPQREVHGGVTGKVLRHWVDDDGHARATLRFTGVTKQHVIDMFTKEDLRAYFPTAQSFGRHALDDGGQAMLENPLPGPPIMYTQIHPDADGIHSTFQGLIYGGSKITLSDDGKGGVLLDENTDVRPNLKGIPGESLLEAVPFFGMFQRAGRELMENTAGAALAKLHAALVPALALDAMVKTLARRAAQD